MKYIATNPGSSAFVLYLPILASSEAGSAIQQMNKKFTKIQPMQLHAGYLNNVSWIPPLPALNDHYCQ